MHTSPPPRIWEFGVVQETAGSFHPSPAPFHARPGSTTEPSALLINAFLVTDSLQLLLNTWFRQKWLRARRHHLIPPRVEEDARDLLNRTQHRVRPVETTEHLPVVCRSHTRRGGDRV